MNGEVGKLFDIQRAVSRLANRSAARAYPAAARTSPAPVTSAAYAQSVGTGWALLSVICGVLMVAAGAVGDALGGSAGRHAGLGVATVAFTLCAAGMVVNIARVILIRTYHGALPRVLIAPGNWDIAVIGPAVTMVIVVLWP